MKKTRNGGIFLHIICLKILVFKIYKELLQHKNISNPLKWEKDFKKHLSKDMEVVNNYMKRYSI